MMGGGHTNHIFFKLQDANGYLMCGFWHGCITASCCLHDAIRCSNVLWMVMMILEMVLAILDHIKKKQT
jgi:hypothetical protein